MGVLYWRRHHRCSLSNYTLLATFSKSFVATFMAAERMSVVGDCEGAWGTALGTGLGTGWGTGLGKMVGRIDLGFIFVG